MKYVYYFCVGHPLHVSSMGFYSSRSAALKSLSDMIAFIQNRIDAGDFHIDGTPYTSSEIDYWKNLVLKRCPIQS